MSARTKLVLAFIPWLAGSVAGALLADDPPGDLALAGYILVMMPFSYFVWAALYDYNKARRSPR
ncbi:MAG: hypothetical protein RDU24_08980 [Humidesulfovibrio sp.]|uniref:hypothetical protein n=1 Tax=Humidesulfovibrio sp. TaxID=2910988 RepID=UPI0027E5EC4B|nr:hypothetical protein [Humidesulfovibrio sp.]MDQ7835502.1 hypothetical protein [Humidesulfovibrio sp.]